MRYLKQSTSAPIVVGPFLDKNDGITAEIAIASGSVTAGIIKGATRTALTLTSWAHVADGYYSFTLATGDTDTLGQLRLTFRDDTTFLPVFEDFQVMLGTTFDALYGSSGLPVAPTAIEIADAVLTRDMALARSSYSFSASDRNLLQAISFLRNKWSISGATLNVTTENDTTTAWTAALSTTSGANPVTGTDPA